MYNFETDKATRVKCIKELDRTQYNKLHPDHHLCNICRS